MLFLSLRYITFARSVHVQRSSAPMHTHTRTHKHTHARAHTHTHTHARTQTYMHTQVSPLPLVFVNIKPQKDYLNMTSACLCVNVWRRRAVLFATHTDALARLAVILTSAASLNEDVNTEHIQNCSESHFLSICLFHLSKTILIQKSKNIHGNPSK